MSDTRDQRIETYYHQSAWDLAERIVDLEDRQRKLLDLVSDWCTEANDVGGVDATDLAFRLDAAGYRLPSDRE